MTACRLVNEQFFPKGSEWVEVFKKEEVKKEKIEIILSSDYIVCNKLQELAVGAMIYEDRVSFYNALNKLYLEENDIDGLLALNKVFSRSACFRVDTNNGNLIIFNEEE